MKRFCFVEIWVAEILHNLEIRQRFVVAISLKHKMGITLLNSVGNILCLACCMIVSIFIELGKVVSASEYNV
jgi:hypothetical protein